MPPPEHLLPGAVAAVLLAAVAPDDVQKAADKRKACEDVQWALLNSKEFLFRH